MKIVVDTMPYTGAECSYAENHHDPDGVITLCKFSCSKCPGSHKCIYLTPYNIPISPNDYQKACLRTESAAPDISSKTNQYARILQGLMGLNGESGECIDILKKVLFQGHDLDKERLASELGDVAWYLAVSADAIGYDLETIFKKNIEKLYKRYPNGFEADKSVHRSEGDD